MRRKHGVLAVLVLALLLGLLLSAAPALAVTTPGTVHGYMLGLLYDGDMVGVPNPDGSWKFTNYIAYGVLVRAGGADADLLLGYGVVRLDGVMGNFGNPNHFGDNYHEGDFVILSEDPGTFWDPSKSYWENLTAGNREESWLWKGWWIDGMTHNNHNHHTTLSLDGCGEALANYHADVAWQSVVIDPNPTENGPFIATPINWVVSISY